MTEPPMDPAVIVERHSDPDHACAVLDWRMDAAPGVEHCPLYRLARELLDARKDAALRVEDKRCWRLRSRGDWCQQHRAPWGHVGAW